MPVDELHGIAGLTARVLLCQADLLLGGIGREQHVVAQAGEVGVGEREQAVQHEAARDAHGLLGRVDLARVALEKELLGLFVERTVECDCVLVHAAPRGCRAGKIEPLERRELETRLRGGIGGHEGRPHRTRDGEVGRHRERVRVERPERLHDRGVVGDAALQHDMRPHALAAHHAVQVVAHDGEGKAGGYVALGGTGGEGRTNGALHEDRATLAQIDRCFARKRERSVLGERYGETSGLLLDKAARSGSANLVHLKVGDLPAGERDELGILSADLEDGVDLRVGMCRAGSLAGDLVHHGVGAHELADEAAAGARRGHGADLHLGTQAGGQRCQPLAHGTARVVASAQVLGIEHAATGVEEDQVRRGRPYVDSQKHRDAAGQGVALPILARQHGEALAGTAPAVRQRCQTGQLARLEARVVEHTAQGIEGRRPAARRRELRGMERRARCLEEEVPLACNEPIFAQLEDLAHGSHHAGVQQHPARERHGRLHGQAAHDERLVALHHGVAEAEQNVLHGDALLLAVDDVRLGKDGAASRDAWNLMSLGAPHKCREVLDPEPQAGHLVLEERAGTRGAALVHGELGHRRREPADEVGVLTADLDDRAGLRRQDLCAGGNGRHVLEHGQRGTRLGERTCPRARRRDASAALGRQRRGHAREQVAQAGDGITVVRPPRAPKHGRRAPRTRALHRGCARPERDHLDRARAHIDSQRVVLRHSHTKTPPPPLGASPVHKALRARRAILLVFGQKGVTVELPHVHHVVKGDELGDGVVHGEGEALAHQEFGEQGVLGRDFTHGLGAIKHSCLLISVSVRRKREWSRSGAVVNPLVLHAVELDLLPAQQRHIALGMGRDEHRAPAPPRQ